MNKELKTDKSGTTVLIITVGFLAIYLAFHWQWAVYVSMSIGLSGVVSKYLSRKIEWIWLKTGEILSLIIPNILLGLVFFLILFPLSLASKLFTKDPLMLSGKYNTYFTDVNKESDKKSLENPW